MQKGKETGSGGKGTEEGARKKLQEALSLPLNNPGVTSAETATPMHPPSAQCCQIPASLYCHSLQKQQPFGNLPWPPNILVTATFTAIFLASFPASVPFAGVPFAAGIPCCGQHPCCCLLSCYCWGVISWCLTIRLTATFTATNFPRTSGTVPLANSGRGCNHFFLSLSLSFFPERGGILLFLLKDGRGIMSEAVQQRQQ